MATFARATLCTLLLGAFSTAAFAQQPEPQPTESAVSQDATDTEEDSGAVIVTGTRTPKAVDKIPGAITVISPADVQRSLSITEDNTAVLAKTVPGYSESNQTLNTLGETMRGRTALYLFDGVPQSTPLRDGSRNATFTDMSIVERIEVIGGASAAEGIGAAGGVINYITKRATKEGLHANVGGRLGTQFRDDSGIWGVKGDVAYKSGDFDLFAAAAYVDRGMAYDANGRRILDDDFLLLLNNDAALDPDAGDRADRLDWNGLPILPPRKAERQGPIGDVAADAARTEREEHWRLLYVALTRAEERLVVAGSLGPRARGEVKPESWFSAVEAAMESLGASWEPDELWGEARRWRGTEQLVPRKAEPETAPVADQYAQPDWLRAAAPAEARPPRPLAPSAQVEDDIPYPPPGPAMRVAAERGRWLHALFERLPDVPADRRRVAADRWLVQQGVEDAATRADIAAQALRVIEAPDFAALFGPGALAEAPIAAVVGDQVIAGTVDRLCIGPDRIQIADFKTGRVAPLTLAEVPPAHVRQMAAYVAALRVIFPGRVVEAGLLYTSAPRLIVLSDDLLSAHKPDYAPAQENLPFPPLETDGQST